MPTDNPVANLIDKWPSLSEFARDAGVTYGAAKQMRRRNSIPVTYWPPLISSDTGRTAGISSELLMLLHANVAAA